jgi:hypothetical protein
LLGTLDEGVRGYAGVCLGWRKVSRNSLAPSYDGKVMLCRAFR